MNYDYSTIFRVVRVTVSVNTTSTPRHDEDDDDIRGGYFKQNPTDIVRSKYNSLSLKKKKKFCVRVDLFDNVDVYHQYFPRRYL